jgi:hypothetical protein
VSERATKYGLADRVLDSGLKFKAKKRQRLSAALVTEFRFDRSSAPPAVAVTVAHRAVAMAVVISGLKHEARTGMDAVERADGRGGVCNSSKTESERGDSCRGQQRFHDFLPEQFADAGSGSLCI